MIVYIRQLSEKLPDNIELEVKKHDSNAVKLTGAIELHRLAVEDLDQLKKRVDELNAEIVNTTCSVVTLDIFMLVSFCQSLLTEMERRIRMGPIKFISSLGGLFRLCLGFIFFFICFIFFFISFISFFEIIY